ncbi:hypothetical protein BDM02DRAFT_3109767 [Thelephora ganbajun]|uniref:Uncharacterized protein n=1 Tax=Thelephora ganbajun TaxID=370292 RepID=A0ACB6ZR11_THEGA|nr:hypothetical protein BDM02DRAFT_3109767 [Thelephora ganbajun]
MSSSLKSSSSSIPSSSSNTSLRKKFTSMFKSKNSSKAQYKPSCNTLLPHSRSCNLYQTRFIVPKHDESDGVDRRFVTAFDSVKTGYIQQPMSRGICL